MGKYFFYCFTEHCRSWSYGYGARLTLDKVAQELGGKKLCRACFDAGYRIRHGWAVIKGVS